MYRGGLGFLVEYLTVSHEPVVWIATNWDVPDLCSGLEWFVLRG